MLVRRIRRQRGWSQAQLADRAKTTQSAIARLEGGGRSPSVATLAHLLRAMGHEFAMDARPSEFGIDRSLIVERLARTPLQRLRDLRSFVRSIVRMRESG